MHRTVKEIREQKGNKKIAVVTAYDYTMASLLDRAGMDILLVGDSAAMVMMGHDSTQKIGMDEMCLFTSSVAAGTSGALVVADMPFMSCQSPDAAAKNADRLVHAGAHGVKIEGGCEMALHAARIAEHGIPVMGHIGYCPQTGISGASKRCAMSEGAVSGLVGDALALEEAGAFALVLEMVSAEGAARITDTVGIPTIGIGSGPACDGQVLVGQDMLGMYERIRPSFARRYRDLASEITAAAAEYRDDIVSGAFPAPEHGFSMKGGTS